jgi:LPS export ABC transporter protein LptC
MNSWQKRARFAVAVFGVAAAVGVYFAIGRRAPAAPPPAIERVDPKASTEGFNATLTRTRNDKRDFEIGYATHLTYPDGQTRMTTVVVKVTKDDGRTFSINAGEAVLSADETRVDLSGAVKLVASDGFEMTTDAPASYNRESAVVHSEGPVAFKKGRMSGSGATIDYNFNSDVLMIGKDAHVITVDDRGAPTLDFASGSATLDRLQHALTLDGAVHVLRDAQTMDADHATARLAPNDDFITFIELRGNARVGGGSGSLQAMTARDIDLDYTDDGKALERVVLNGGAALAMTAASGSGSRKLSGEWVEVHVIADGSVTAATARTNVRLTLPPAGGAAPKSVTASALDATGAPGQGLNAARFTDSVQYQEDATRTTAARTVRSQRLDITLNGDAVGSANFAGGTTFDEQGFRAQGLTAQYDPATGRLRLSGSDSRGAPCVADDQISVDAQMIDVAVESRKLTADGGVKTTLRPRGAAASSNSACRLDTGRGGGAARTNDGETRLPGLLKQDQAASIIADHLEYGGTGKGLTFTGGAALIQGNTAVRGETIAIDQDAGDLAASGNARFSSESKDKEAIDGRADAIVYENRRRTIAYSMVKGSSGLVLLKGPEGNLQAKQVDVLLGPDDAKAREVQAYTDVTARIERTNDSGGTETRKATGDRLKYDAAREQYDMVGTVTTPVQIVDGNRCFAGKTLTFFKSTDSISVDGKGEMKTAFTACLPVTSSR